MFSIMLFPMGTSVNKKPLLTWYVGALVELVWWTAMAFSVLWILVICTAGFAFVFQDELLALVQTHWPEAARNGLMVYSQVPIVQPSPHNFVGFANLSASSPDWGFTLKSLTRGTIIFGIAVGALYCGRGVLRTFLDGIPFQKRNVLRLRVVAVGMVVLALLDDLVDWWSSPQLAHEAAKIGATVGMTMEHQASRGVLLFAIAAVSFLLSESIRVGGQDLDGLV